MFNYNENKIRRVCSQHGVLCTPLVISDSGNVALCYTCTKKYLSNRLDVKIAIEHFEKEREEENIFRIKEEIWDCLLDGMIGSPERFHKRISSYIPISLDTIEKELDRLLSLNKVVFNEGSYSHPVLFNLKNCKKKESYRDFIKSNYDLNGKEIKESFAIWVNPRFKVKAQKKSEVMVAA